MQCIDAESAPVWVERIFDDSRLIPLVLVSLSSHSGQPLLDPAHLAETLADQATVTVLADPAASRAMSERMPNHLDTYNGAVRIFVPNADCNDPHHRHPTVLVNPAQLQGAMEKITRQIRGTATAHSRIPTSLHYRVVAANLTRADDEAEKDRLAAEITCLQQVLRRDNQTITELRREQRRLTKQLRNRADTSNRALPPCCYTGSEEQFRYEVTQIWLWTLTESERAVKPVADYILGPDWLASVEAMDQASRRDIIEATVDVVTRQAAHKPSRDVHPLRTHTAGGAPRRRRAGNATAMRCSIKRNTPAAPRLMWWVRLDHSIELGRVALHDDYRLR
ncbi:hypothetical protein ACFV2U_32720 [Streptomyces sp. NPDC059697]|uniref:hypothetical protein n=1 Tax=Streptomyces sp. NPDC059697 TaxID=3346912 RepID=UPI0036CF5A97